MSKPLSSDKYWIVSSPDVALLIETVNKFLLLNPGWELLGGVSVGTSGGFAQSFKRTV